MKSFTQLSSVIRPFGRKSVLLIIGIVIIAIVKQLDLTEPTYLLVNESICGGDVDTISTSLLKLYWQLRLLFQAASIAAAATHMKEVCPGECFKLKVIVLVGIQGTVHLTLQWTLVTATFDLTVRHLTVSCIYYRV